MIASYSGPIILKTRASRKPVAWTECCDHPKAMFYKLHCKVCSQVWGTEPRHSEWLVVTLLAGRSEEIIYKCFSSLCREDGSVVYNCCWSSPAHSFSGLTPVGLVTIFYCLRFETSPPHGNLTSCLCLASLVFRLYSLGLGHSTENTSIA
jgi:hypothetical protein